MNLTKYLNYSIRLSTLDSCEISLQLHHKTPRKSLSVYQTYFECAMKYTQCCASFVRKACSVLEPPTTMRQCSTHNLTQEPTRQEILRFDQQGVQPYRRAHVICSLKQSHVPIELDLALLANGRAQVASMKVNFFFFGQPSHIVHWPGFGSGWSCFNREGFALD